MASAVMKKEDFETVVLSLDKMSAAQRRQVSAHIDFLAVGGKTNEAPVAPADLASSQLAAALKDELVNRSLLVKDHFWPHLKKYPQAPSQIRDQEAFLLSRLRGPALTPTEKRNLFRNVAWALVDWLEKRNGEFYQQGPTRAVFESISRIPDAVEFAWPGYMANGWFRAVATADHMLV